MKVQVDLNLDGSTNEELCVDGEKYCNHMSSSAYYSAAHIVSFIIVVRAAISALHAALVAPYSVTSTSAIKIAREVLTRHLTKLGTTVENVVNDPEVEDENREIMVEASGMKLRSQVHPQEHHFEAKNTDVSGKVRINAKGGADAHEWVYTSDIINFTNKIHLRATTSAHTEVEGFTPGTKYAFFHSPVTPDGPHDFEGPIFLRVT